MGLSARPSLAKVTSWERRLSELSREMEDAYPENQQPRFIAAADIAWALLYAEVKRMQAPAIDELRGY